MCAQLLKPVYIRGRDLPVSVSKTTNFEISEVLFYYNVLKLRQVHNHAKYFLDIAELM